MDMYEHFVEAAESILSQSYDDVELVIVVDGTPSVFDCVVDEYGERDDVVIHVNSENVGLLQSRNTGAEIATGEIVAFIDDDAVADEQWVAKLVSAYEQHDVEAAGGRMTPIWMAEKPLSLPEEFYWLVGVTHRGFGDEGEARNTFGSNISFTRDVFLELGGFDTEIGGRKGDRNLQGGETELCARLRSETAGTLYYVPDAKVGHKVFEYRTQLGWLLRRAFWQGYSKRAMEVLVPESNTEESAYLVDLLLQYMPDRFRNAILGPSLTEAKKLLLLGVFTACVGIGYLYAFKSWR
jgi:glycosyltransferase involved in cell wall biosynthesis